MADFPLALEYCKVTRHRACFQWAHLTAFHVQKGKAVASLFCVTLSGLSLPLGNIRVGGTLEVTSHHRCFPGCLLAEPCLMGLCGWMPDALGGQSSSGKLELRALLFSQFFRKYLTPVERADVILVALESMINGSLNDVSAASKMLKMILKHPVTDVARVGF